MVNFFLSLFTCGLPIPFILSSCCSLETNVHEAKFHFKTYDVIMYFSLCKPLQLSPVICPDLNSKICIVKSLAVKPFIPDAGSVIISSGMKDDNLHLKFSSETPCQKNGHNYSTIINFSCKNDVSILNFFFLYYYKGWKFMILICRRA